MAGALDVLPPHRGDEVGIDFVVGRSLRLRCSDTLVARGYTDRRVDGQDRRRLVGTLTERGKARR